MKLKYLLLVIPLFSSLGNAQEIKAEFKKEIKKELAELIKTDEHLQFAIFIICTIPGIGMLTAAIILGETNGFELIRNVKQLTSYAGLDVREKQSGTSIKGKATISKRGNKYLRKAMHFPALTAIRYTDRYKAIFARGVSKHGIKMKAVVAVQRKILEMSYIVFKKSEKFDKDYFENQIKKVEELKMA